MYVNINHFYIQKNKLFYIQLSTLITIYFYQIYLFKVYLCHHTTKNQHKFCLKIIYMHDVTKMKGSGKIAPTKI